VQYALQINASQLLRNAHHFQSNSCHGIITNRAAIINAIRGTLYTLTDNPYFLVGVQLMDGIGAAIFGVVSVLVIADLTSGTGRFNFTQGVVATATGLGASL
jgi:hypothetical protein